MARSFLSAMVKMSREMERAERARIREAERQQRARTKQQHFIEKSHRDAYLASQEAEVQAANHDLAHQIEELQNLLGSRLGQDPGLDFKKLLKIADERILDSIQGFSLPEKPVLTNFLPKEPSIFVRWLPLVTSNFQKRLTESKTRFNLALTSYESIVRKRSDHFAAMKKNIDEQNNAVVEFARSYTTGEPNAVCTYFELVLGSAKYPETFPIERKIAYVQEAKQLVVEFDLPLFSDAVPTAEKYRYVRKSDEVVEAKKSEKIRQSLYSNTIAQTVLRHLYDIFYGDKQEVVETAVLNAHVSTIDPATGHPIHPCLISVRTSRDRFLNLDLRYVDPISCLRDLRASISNHPGELVAVKPILEFNMIDPRFVQETDILSSLDQRPNLMELSPSEFESLITNLFAQMGLETKLTQPSRDGGVDCVAFDSRPVLGGKVVIQAKRYKNTVGVSAVRDLFGTLHNEGASKGILVTTSGFGKATYEFANGKPIELITGSNLLYLLKEYGDVEAKIEVPPDWIDPRSDIA